MGFAALLLAVDHEFVDIGHAIATVTPLDVFQVFQALKMQPHLSFTLPCVLTHLAACEVAFVLIDNFGFAKLGHQSLDGIEESARLRRQFVKASAQDFRSKLIGDFNVLESRFDVFSSEVVLFDWALVLVQQGHCFDEGQVFFMVAACSSALCCEGQFVCVRVDDLERTKKTLRVLKQSQDMSSFLF